MPNDFSVNLRSPSQRIRQPFNRANAAAFRHDNSVSLGIKWTRCPGWILVSGQCTLALETGEDAERVNTLRDTSGDRDVTFAQTQHLQRLDETSISRGTSGTNGQMRPRDPEAQRYFSRRIVRDRTWVVVM